MTPGGAAPPDARLPQPRTAAGRAGLAALLDAPRESLLAVDYDGTLAPIVDDPDAARAHPAAVPALARVGCHLGTVAVITGRPVEAALRLGGFAGAAGLGSLVVLGHYGLERWEARTGEVARPPAAEGVARVKAALPGLLERHGAAGARVEDKGASVAVHTRGAPDPQRLLDRLRPDLEALAAAEDLAVEPGRLVVELRPPGTDKGGALRALVAERGARAVLFAGDDLGDLAAFAAVEDLRAHGLPGLTVCSGSAEVRDLAERADLVVDGPPGVAALLDALAEALEPSPG